MVPRPLLPIGCFLLAMFAGWAAREAKVSADAAQAATQQTALPDRPPMPEGMDDLATRIWLAENLADADSERLKEIASRLRALTEFDERAWQALFSCWFEKSPAAAWDFASGQPNLRGIALEKWAALDPAAARRVLPAPSGDDLVALVHGALEVDVRAGFRLLEEALAAIPGKHDDPKDPFQGVQLFGVKEKHFAELASMDPEAATEWAKRLGIDEFDGALLWGRWKNNPAAVRQWLSQQERPDRLLRELADFAEDGDHYQPELMDFVADLHPAGNHRNETIKYLLTSLARHDPDFAAKEAARVIPDASMRAEAIGEIASLVARTDFTKAWSMLETLDPSIQGIHRVELPKIEIRAGSESDALAAPFQYGWHLTSMRGLESPAAVKSLLLVNLMDTDKDEAIRLMDRIPAQDLFPTGDYALERWVYRDYEEAIRWLAGKLGGQGDIGEIEDMVNRADMEVQLPLLRSLPAGTVRSALAAKAAAKMTEADPLAALDFAREATTSDEAVTRVYDAWSENDPVVALNHLAGDDHAPTEAWEEVTEEAFKKDPEIAAQAIETLPISPARDTAIRSMVKSMVETDPLQAGAWALALGDADKRKAAMEDVLCKVSLDLRLAREPATAAELRQQLNDAADLPEAERQHWSDRIDREFTGP